MSNLNSRPFIRGSIAIESMRANGYKNAAYALAELIDNSVQAEADNIKLMCYEENKIINEQNRKVIEHIGVFDNGKGMDSNTLSLSLEFGGSQNRENPIGLGKFGMGLPNSSISQCKKVEVWSWQNKSDPLYTYLDIDEITAGKLENIPEPRKMDIPAKYKKEIVGSLPESGTFILWSNLDQLSWRTSKSILKHSEHLVGRMYRKFIERNDIRIEFIPLVWDDEKKAYLDKKDFPKKEFRANDPLYLMKKSTLPELPGNFKGEAPFEVKHYIDDFPIKYNGSQHKVSMKVSLIKKDVLQALRKDKSVTGKVGASKWGKEMAKNTGLSILRAGRELELRQDFFSNILSKEFRNNKARYMGVEINFEPGLDQVFGVLNNKQEAVNLKPLNIDEDANFQGFEDVEAYKNDLKQNQDPKESLYKMHAKLVSLVRNVEKEAQKLPVDSINVEDQRSDSAKKTEREISVIGINRSNEGHGPDNLSSASTKDDINKVINALDPNSKSVDEYKKELKEYIDEDIKFKINLVSTDDEIFFDVAPSNAITVLQLNNNHLFYKKILKDSPPENRALLYKCLGAWARMELENENTKAREKFAFTRKKWGQMLKEYLDDADE